CKPHPGKEVADWTGDFTMYPVIRTLAGLSYTKDTSASEGGPQLIDMQKLEVEVEVDGGNGTPAEARHLGAGIARKYYSTYGTEHVNLPAHPHPCYGFARWSGEGVPFLEDHQGNPDFENPAPLDDEEGPVTATSIWVAPGSSEETRDRAVSGCM